MASSINNAVPATGAALASEQVRSNFAAAKSEIAATARAHGRGDRRLHVSLASDRLRPGRHPAHHPSLGGGTAGARRWRGLRGGVEGCG